ncbi:uncharacterized protein LOC118461181 [Anopheles albimanus]|uniref:uncharacterized protein LOC118461181 n=1 Tax=Anopheles albimanus TaxID=7167 RepID=UPI00164010C2|nr:uncharacterized protein LOC118461181 [Anopheles albimanus]
MLRISKETFDEIKSLSDHGTDPVQEGKLVKSKLTNLLVWKRALLPDIVTDFYHGRGVRSLLPPSGTSSSIDEAEQQRLANIWNHFSNTNLGVEMPIRKQNGSGSSGSGRNCVTQSEQTLPVYSTQTYRNIPMFCNFCHELAHSTNYCPNAADMIELFAGQSPQVQRALLSFLL